MDRDLESFHSSGVRRRQSRAEEEAHVSSRSRAFAGVPAEDYFFAALSHNRPHALTEWCKFLDLVAISGLEPELFALRGRRVNQLHHIATPALRRGARANLALAFHENYYTSKHSDRQSRELPPLGRALACQLTAYGNLELIHSWNVLPYKGKDKGQRFRYPAA